MGTIFSSFALIASPYLLYPARFTFASHVACSLCISASSCFLLMGPVVFL
jgi:hypothetical protein